MDKKHPCPSALATQETSRPTDLSDPVQADLFDHPTAEACTSDVAENGNQMLPRSNLRPVASGQLAALNNHFSQLEKEADDMQILLLAQEGEIDLLKHKVHMFESFLDEKRQELLAVSKTCFEVHGLKVDFSLDYPSRLQRLLEDGADAFGASRLRP